MKKLILIDGHAIIHRAYFAFPQTLKTRKGELVNAVYGFTRMLLTVIRDLKPSHLAVAFDLRAPTFRHKEFIGYQARRPEREAEMEDQFGRVQEVVRVLNIPIFAMAGFEADDVIGTLAKQASRNKGHQAKDIEVVIVTGDRDIMQLVGPRVRVYAPVRGFARAKMYGLKEVREELGVRPEQIVDYKALVGDSSDNYPGVPGIGPKTAVWLLGEHNSLDNIYKRLGKIKPAVVNKLKEGRESAYLSQKLARIVTGVPIRLNLKACRIHDYDRGKAVELFEKLEFKSLIEKLPRVKEEEKPKKNEQMRLI